MNDGVVTNAEDGILGADNKATVAALLDAVRQIVRAGTPHAGIELVLTAQEEVGLRGAKAFDHDRLHARIGYVFDHASPIGGMVLEAPSQYSIDARFLGREAHSGIAPEEGRSAIAAAARAIAEMRLGRIDDETTANIGTVHGGSARNIVAGLCTVQAETRSLDPAKALRQCQAMIDSITHAADAEGCEVETATTHEYEAYRLRRADPVVVLAEQALDRLRLRPRGAPHRRRRRLAHLQRARAAVPEPSERNARDPHARGGDRGGRCRRHRPHRAGTCRGRPRVVIRAALSDGRVVKYEDRGRQGDQA